MKNSYKSKIKKLKETGFFHIFILNIINKAVGFIGNLIIIRILSKAEYGIYSSAFNYLSLVLIASGLGMVSGSFQLCSEFSSDQENHSKIYQYSSTFGFWFDCFLTVFLILSAIFGRFSFVGVKRYLLFLAFEPPLRIIYNFQAIYLRSKLMNREFAITNSINSFAIYLLGIIGAWLYGVEGFILGRYLAYIMTFLFVLIFYKVPFALKLENLDNEIKKSLFHLSIVGMLSNGMAEVLYLADIAVLGKFVSNGEIIASYKVATIIPSALVFLPMALITYIYPYFANHRSEKLWTVKYYKISLYAMCLINGFITAVGVIFAKLIITTFYGTGYIDAVPVFKLLMISFFFNCTFRIPSGNLLATQRKVVFNFWVSLGSAILNIVLNILLIPKYHSMGAAFATLLTTVLIGLISTFYYTYIIKKIETRTQI